MRSTSELTKELLAGMPAGALFTAEELYETLVARHSDCEVSRGGVSGFLAKIPPEGVKLVGKEGRKLQWAIVDPGAVVAMRTNAKPKHAPGGHSGPRRHRAVAPSRESVKEQLLALASEFTERALALAVELEKIQSPIEDFGTAELLEELGKRAQATGAADA